MVLDSMKVKIKNSENVPYVVTFPSGYKPGSAEEKWTVYQHAQKPQQQALVVETVRDWHTILTIVSFIIDIMSAFLESPDVNIAGQKG